jgi:hypothetical protein
MSPLRLTQRTGAAQQIDVPPREEARQGKADEIHPRHPLSSSQG